MFFFWWRTMSQTYFMIFFFFFFLRHTNRNISKQFDEYLQLYVADSANPSLLTSIQ